MSGQMGGSEQKAFCVISPPPRLTIIKGTSSASFVKWRRKQIASYRQANQGYYQHKKKNQHEAFES